MDIKEMRQFPDGELLKEIEKARRELFRMRFRGKGKDIENPGALRRLRKDIARMQTVLSERRAARARRERSARVLATEASAAQSGGGTAG